MNQIIVSKFGGTSMGSKAAMLNAAKIVHSKPSIRVVVVSATSGTTNQLLKISQYKNTEETAHAYEELNLLKLRHIDLAQSLECDHSQLQSLTLIFNEIEEFIKSEENINEEKLDSLLSMGERLSSVIFVQALRILKWCCSTPGTI